MSSQKFQSIKRASAIINEGVRGRGCITGAKLTCFREKATWVLQCCTIMDVMCDITLSEKPAFTGANISVCDQLLIVYSWITSAYLTLIATIFKSHTGVISS